jgi:hypothetical protein
MKVGGSGYTVDVPKGWDKENPENDDEDFKIDLSLVWGNDGGSGSAQMIVHKVNAGISETEVSGAEFKDGIYRSMKNVSEGFKTNVYDLGGGKVDGARMGVFSYHRKKETDELSGVVDVFTREAIIHHGEDLYFVRIAADKKAHLLAFDDLEHLFSSWKWD